MGDEKVVENQVIVVGYALEAKKVDSFMKPSLINYAKDHGIHFVAVDLQNPLSLQGPFHCLIHKLYGPEWDRKLLDFQSRHPGVVIIDSPSAVKRIHDRTSMLEAADTLPIRTPKQIVLDDHNASFPGGVEFPVIVKPLAANGGAACHEMFVVFDEVGLKMVETPVVVQEFVNHGGVVYKVYVAGDYVRCVKRPSLPDVNAADAAEGVIIPFSRISNLATASAGDSDKLEAEMPPSELINDLARGLRHELKLNLFNFDLIRDLKDGSFLVIDINYFPGYAKVPGFEAFLTDFFLDITGNNKPKNLDVATPDQLASN